MRALVLRSFGAPLVEEKVPVPTLGGEDVLVRPRAVGICGTDLKISGGRLAGIELPLIIGHEIAGEVAAVGSEVEGLKEGDRVTLHSVVPCGRCDYCRTGRDSACVGGKRRLGFEMDGGLADFVRAPARNALLIPANTPFEQAAIVPDAVAVPWHGIRGRAQLKPGEVALIIGVGGLGIHGVQIARASGARVIAVDVAEDKLKLAKEMGADEVIDAKEGDFAEKVRALSGGLGAHAAFEFVGSAEAQEACLRALRPDGVLVVLGYYPGRTFQVDQTNLVYSQLRIMGALNCRRQDMADVLEMMAQGKIKPVVGRTMSFSQVNEALEVLEKGDVAGRLVLVP